MNRQLDIVFVNTNNRSVYGVLADNYSAIEPPQWSCLLAQSCRAKGYGVAILDAIAENLTHEETAQRIIDLKPRFCCFVTYGQNPNSGTTNMIGVFEVAKLVKESSDIKTISIGSHTSALPFDVLGVKNGIDYIAFGEGVYTLHRILDGIDNDKNGGLGYLGSGGYKINNNPNGLVSTENMDRDLPGYAWDLLPYKEKPFDLYRAPFWHAWYQEKNRRPYTALYTSLGCQFKCLSGSTLINTIYGKITIKELAENYKTVPVYTYDSNSGEVAIADAINIQKTGVNKQLVRVHFDDDSYIDCTPDHKFYTFKNGNQNSPTTESLTEAKDLVEGTRIVAIKETINAYGYKHIGCRRKSYRKCRLHLEYKIGRKMTRHEYCHHLDHVKTNDHPNNLHFCANAKEHFDFHPEISERMRLNNPAKNMTQEWRDKITKSQTGLTRSVEQRLRYSESKKGRKNPNYKEGLHIGQKSRVEINHKVTYVESLDKQEDVYCMTVPNYGLFFANDVLVKNCNFCMINTINRTTSNKNYVASDSNTMRFWSPEFVLKEFDKIVSYGIDTIRISDEMFFLNKKYYEPLLLGLKERGYGKHLNMWTYSRIDTVNDRFLDLFREGGVKLLGVGIEAANQEIRRELYKGKFENLNIRDVVKQIHNHGLYVGANYIFGHPDETEQTMRETLDLALELNTENANFYHAMALPGSPLYYDALEKGWELPKNFDAWSFYSYNSQPLPTKHLTAGQVLKFRDDAWYEYWTSPKFLELIFNRFGQEAVDTIKTQTQIKLKRKILGD